MCRVTMGHLRDTIGHLRVTIGHPRVIFSMSKHKANTTELHPKVRQTCYTLRFKRKNVNVKSFMQYKFSKHSS